MNDLASVRAEIKNWERTFRANEGRDPSVDDIRKLPQIAQKYKLYKKLSKAAAAIPPQKPSNPSQSTSQSPSTPTRPSRARVDHASLSALNSRVVTSAAPLSSFNPFSPRKAKGKERERLTPQIPQPLFNPFASPSKPRPQAQASKGPQGLFPLLKSPSRPASPPVPPSAVVRARKRLRGEPVSPSPSKEKRRKTVSQTTLNFPRLNFASKKGPPFNGAAPKEDNDDAFIDDSPVKASARKFSHLFDEAQPRTTGDIFGLKKDTNSQLSKDLFGAKDMPTKSAKRSASPASSEDEDEDEEASSGRSTFHTRLTSPLEELELSFDHGLADGDDLEEVPSIPRSKSPLLPPSPPPASSTASRAPAKGKRKAGAKAVSQRKKMKLAAKNGSDDEGSTSDNSDLKAKVKIVNRPQAKKVGVDDDELGPDFDPVLDLPRVSRLDGASSASHLEGTGTVEINLPDKLREVLDLDPNHWEDHDVVEDKLVKGLIYGRRVASYDPKKGEIWDVGEDEVGDDEERCQLVDDDWEGEPVPWEAAEL